MASPILDLLQQLLGSPSMAGPSGMDRQPAIAPGALRLPQPEMGAPEAAGSFQGGPAPSQAQMGYSAPRSGPGGIGQFLQSLLGGGVDPEYQAAMTRARYFERAGLPPDMAQIVGGDEVLSRQYIADQMQPKGPKYGFMSGRDGSIFRTDERAGTINQVYGGKPDTFNTLTPEEELQLGLDPAGTYQRGTDNKISKIGGEGPTVNIDQRAEGAFEKTLAENQAKSFNEMSVGGMEARADLAVIGELGGLLQGRGGMMTGISGWLAQKGIGGEGLSDLQAAQALINKLVPTQRQPGSGSMSDRDVELFTRSLPSLWNTPDGNQKILRVMQGLAQYKQAQGQIADLVMSGEMNRQEARKALMALPNPLAEFSKSSQGASPSGRPRGSTTKSGVQWSVDP